MSFQTLVCDATRKQQQDHLRPAAFMALLQGAGVCSFSVDVATLTTTYTGRKGESYAETGGAPRTVAATYSAEILDAAVRARARGELEPDAFLDRVAAAGILTYEVRIADRVIVYEGHGHSYAESLFR